MCCGSHQIDEQRQYLQRIWRDGHRGSVQDFGRPPSYVPKHPVSLGGSRRVHAEVFVDLVSSKSVFTLLCPVCSPALMNVFLLEVHPSLCMASAVYHSLVRAHTEICQLHRAGSIADKLALRQRLLQRALQSWNTLASPGASYSSQIQKDVGFCLC